jgi:exopolysaccharide biosynthesis polyprenyl glycosylphosphotransferase
MAQGNAFASFSGAVLPSPLGRGNVTGVQGPIRGANTVVTTQVGTVDGSLIEAAAAGSVELTGQRYKAAPGLIRLERWSALFVALDTAAAGAAVAITLVARVGFSAAARTVDYRLVALCMVPGWLAVMALAGAYDHRHIATGFEQYRRVVNGAVWILAGAGFVSFALHADISRAFILSSIPLAALMTVVGRQGARRVLHQRLSKEGVATHRVVAIGLPPEIQDLVQHMRRASYAGFRVVGALTPGSAKEPHLPAGVVWAGDDLDQAVQRSLEIGADTIAIAAPHLLPQGGLRRLSWELEGTDIDLVLAPAITDIAGPRIHIRPVDGLPLMFVDKPQFKGARRLLKEVADRAAALILMLVLSPVILSSMLAVKLTSPGPLFFKQLRFGLGGQTFSILKLRTMCNGADSHEERAKLANSGATDELLFFKLERDPRITRIGRFLRRFSLDELPQLWNVVNGDMSLVGPRPLPAHGELSGSDLCRRHVVKPGMTGLWQISGRGDLSFEESVRLDLYYVDNWSLGLDLVLLWKTFATVVRGNGAY